MSLSKEDIESKILHAVNANNEIADSSQFASQLSQDHQSIVGVLNSLVMENIIKTVVLEKKEYLLTKEADAILEKGSPEFQVYSKLPADGTSMNKNDLEKALGVEVVKVGMNECMKSKWIKAEKPKEEAAPPAAGEKKKEKDVFLARAADSASVKDSVAEQLKSIDSLQAKEINDLKRRKLLVESVIKYFKVSKGDNFAIERKKQESDISREMIQNGSWKTSAFKPYNFNALGKPISSGHLHPLLKVRSQFRDIFFEMGFEEMPTNNFIESSFWNFDALFQPQQHPARDMHDTFFLTKPESTLELPLDYVEKVKKVHEKGGYDSIGYRYDWKIEEAKKNILRTHTTAVSSRMLYKLSQGDFTPKKYFSIDRVFRNEEMDATHLCEFHQVEGMVIDKNLSLGDLIGILTEFFAKIGITDLKFKPAYNPYTEPSMEIFGFHPILNKLIEIGNSGIFRPEMLRPMGLPEDVTVIAWGVSLERPTMILYNIDNIKTLVGHKVDVQMIKTNPIPRLDK